MSVFSTVIRGLAILAVLLAALTAYSAHVDWAHAMDFDLYVRG